MRKLTINFYPDTTDLRRKVLRALPGYSGSSDCVELRSKTVPSPIMPFSYITGSEFAISVVYGASGRFKGYQVELYPGDCTVSCELLTHNDMPMAAQLALSLLQEWLIFWDRPLDLVKLFSVERSKVLNATAGLFVPLESLEEVRLAVSTLSDRAELLHNQKVSWTTAYRDQLQFHGSQRNGHWELHLKDHSVRFFALNDPHFWMSRVPYTLDVEEIPDFYLTLCQEYLFIEVELNKHWLTRNDKVNPANWQSDSDSINAEILALVQDDFGLNQKFPTSMPGDQELTGLSSAQKDLLAWYFDGHDPRRHTMFASQRKSHAAFANACKVIKAIGIDLKIPVANAKQLAAHQDLERYLAATDDFALPDEFECYVFSSTAVSTAIKTPEALFADHERYRAND